MSRGEFVGLFVFAAVVVVTALAASPTAGTGCPEPTAEELVVDGRQPVVLESSPGCVARVVVYRPNWTVRERVDVPVGIPNVTFDWTQDVARARGDGWWAVTDHRIHRLDDGWRYAGTTVPLTQSSRARSYHELSVDGEGRFWVAGRGAVAVHDRDAGRTIPVLNRSVAEVHVAGNTLWTLAGNGTVTRYGLGEGAESPSRQTTVDLDVDGEPSDLARAPGGEWLVLDRDGTVTAYAENWTRLGTRLGGEEEGGPLPVGVLVAAVAIVLAAAFAWRRSRGTG